MQNHLDSGLSHAQSIRNDMMLEVCCSDIDSLKAAKEGGAHRVELCADLDSDGLTPSDELIREAQRLGLWHHVLVRPRAGNFVYDDREVEAMVDSICHLRAMNVDGIVIGALTADGHIDVDACEAMVKASKGIRNVTFHRAFDVCANPLVALERIIALGCNRLLTSGQAPTAAEGQGLIKQLVEVAHGRLSVMPGSGVTPDNAFEILRHTGAHEIHGTLRSMVAGCKVTTIENVQKTVQSISELA